MVGLEFGFVTWEGVLGGCELGGCGLLLVGDVGEECVERRGDENNAKLE